jgi:ribosomal protein L10
LRIHPRFKGGIEAVVVVAAEEVADVAAEEVVVFMVVEVAAVASEELEVKAELAIAEDALSMSLFLLSSEAPLLLAALKRSTRSITKISIVSGVADSPL